MPMDVVPSGLISDKIELSTSADPRLINFDPPAPKTCEYCGTLLYARAFIHVVGERVKEVKWLPGYSRCSCRDSEKEEMADYKRKNNICSDDLGNDFVSRRKRIKEIFFESGLGKRFSGRTFACTERTKENGTAIDISKNYSDNFLKIVSKEKNGLYFVGDKGSGKTHLAAAINNYLDSLGVPVIYVTSFDLLDKIKSTYNNDRIGLNEDGILNLIKNVELLIIDDLGKEVATKWAMQKLFGIINYRYEACKPVIITSNYTPTALAKKISADGNDVVMADAFVDRLVEMTYIVPMGGDSWRRNKKI